MTFSLAVGVLTYLLLTVSVFVQFLGFMAVFMEAMLGMPQFYRNFQNKCTVGMRYGAAHPSYKYNLSVGPSVK